MILFFTMVTRDFEKQDGIEPPIETADAEEGGAEENQSSVKGT